MIVLSPGLIGFIGLQGRTRSVFGWFTLSGAAAAIAYYVVMLGLPGGAEWIYREYTLIAFATVPDAVTRRAHWVYDPSNRVESHPSTAMILMIQTIMSLLPLFVGLVCTHIILLIRRRPRPNTSPNPA